MDKAVVFLSVIHMIILFPVVYGQPVPKLVACANEDCSAPLSVAEAVETYLPVKKTGEHLEFYKGEKIRVFERYLSPPFNKFWRGEVVGVKPVVRAMFPKSMVKELEVFQNQPVTVDQVAPAQQEAGQPGNSPTGQPETNPGLNGETSPTPGNQQTPEQLAVDSAANADHVDDPLIAQMEKLQAKMAKKSNTDEPFGESTDHNPDVVGSDDTEQKAENVVGGEAEKVAQLEESENVEQDRKKTEEVTTQQDTVIEGNQSVEATKRDEEPLAGNNNEEKQLAEEKIIEDEQVVEEKKKNGEQLAEEKREEERAAAEGKIEEERIAAEKRMENEKIAEEKRKEEERIAEEEKRKEEERMAEEKRKEEERIAEEKRKEEERIAEEKRKEEERIAEEEKRKEEERIVEEKRKEEERIAEEEKRKEEERIAEEKRKEEERIAEEEKRKEEDRIAEEKRKEEHRIAEEKRKEEERIAEEKKKEEERIAEEEKRKEEEGTAEEKKKEQERIADEEKNIAEEKGIEEERKAEEEKRVENERIADEKRKEEERHAEEERKMEERKAQEEEDRHVEQQRQLDVNTNMESADVVNTAPPLKPTVDSQVEPTAIVSDVEEKAPEPADPILPSPPQDEVAVDQSANKPADSQDTGLFGSLAGQVAGWFSATGAEAAATDEGVDNSENVASTADTQQVVGEEVTEDIIDPVDMFVNAVTDQVPQPQVTPESESAATEAPPVTENSETTQAASEVDESASAGWGVTTESAQGATSEPGQDLGSQQEIQPMPEDFQLGTETPSPTNEESHQQVPEAGELSDEKARQFDEWVNADEDEGYKSEVEDGNASDDESGDQNATTGEEGLGESTPNLNEGFEATTSPGTIDDTEDIYEDNVPLPPHDFEAIGVTESPAEDLTTAQPESSDQSESRVYPESAYPREFDLASRPISYKYTNIINELEAGLEQQGWIAASLMPPFLQPMLAREPFGLVGYQLMLLLAVGLSICIALFLYMLMSAVMSCITGCTDASKARGFAREALEKYETILAESGDVQSKIKDLSNEASIAQGELTEIREKLMETEEDKSKLAERIEEMTRENTTAMQVLQAEMEQTAGYLKEWEVYGKTQQTLYEAEAVKSQQLASELETVKADAEQASQQLQNRSELSGSKVKEMEENISHLKSQLELLNGELEQKVADSETLLSEKNNLDRRCSQITGELSEMQAELETLSTDKEEMARTLSLRNDELEILRGCVSEMTQLDSSDDDDQKKEAISALLDTAKLKTEKEELQRSYAELEDRLQSEVTCRSNTEEALKNLQLKLDVAGNSLATSQKETSDARAALTHMTDMYERTKLANVRLTADAASAESAGGEDELRQQVNELKAETLQLRETSQQQQEEFKTSERDLRKRVIESERKAHETWLQHREGERKVASLKQELEALRRSYASLEADYQDGEASFRDLQAQLERKERDDASITSERRPPSRSSVRSSRFEDRRSESPFNGSEKPVDPLRAPPPVSTYSKKKKKAKDAQRYAPLSSQHTPPPVHLTPSPNAMMSQQVMPPDLQNMPPQFNPQPFPTHEGPFPMQDPQMFTQDPQQFPHPINNQFGQVPQYPTQDMQQFPPQQYPQQTFPLPEHPSSGQYPSS